MTIKLKELPNREPRKLTISVAPDVYENLEFYASVYEKTYGAKEQLTDLIGPMLECFLASDSGFRKAKKDQQPGTQT